MEAQELKQVHIKLKKLPLSLLKEVDHYIDFLLYKIQKENYKIPEWQKSEVRERLKAYKNNPEQALDFNTAMDDIEKDL